MKPPRLFEVYSEGNFIEATPDTCYFQIGESKYGKPVIDRVVHRGTSLLDATKCTIVSFDSTMRSNISVGLPIDLLVYETGSLKIAAAAPDPGVRPVFPDGPSSVGRGLASRVRATARPRLALAGSPMPIRVALAHRTSYRYDRLVTLSPHEIRLRPAPHCRTPITRLFAAHRAGAAFRQLATGPVRQLGRARSSSRTAPIALDDHGRSRRRPDDHQPVRFFRRALRRGVPVRLFAGAREGVDAVPRSPRRASARLARMDRALSRDRRRRPDRR